MKSIISTLLVFSAFSADAYFYSGNDLREPMQQYLKAEANDKDTDYSKAFEYAGYVIGVYDSTTPFLCTPSKVSRNQILAMIAKHLNSNPEDWHLPARTIVQSSLFKSFPCPSED
ncbi:Rap1a/Tai family immunity protein [Pseudoalteromonas sp. MelDa3]|uniref:Rap1a/Tai family immunity protein n=1 Tax=Pseudoalteromonas sp. MelDa3 TaxID=888435 RepID=UPI000CC4646C|nr:Rap1a/Tai family immunity protein [Pseudoalteromonas sp. MelDa3]PLT26716.1 hypothetical protein CXF89_03940 [Pseudoalteromonas sp. MelDa3]